MTPDPALASAKPGSPQSWNRYAYVQGDPVNYNDPSGRMPICSDGLDVVYFGSADGFGGASCSSDPTGGFCDASERGCGGDPCLSADGFTQNPSPYCQVGGPATPTQTTQPDRCHIEIRYSQIVIKGVTTPFYHTMLVGIDDTTETTLGVIDGWPSPGFINLPAPLAPIPISQLTTHETVNGIYNNANTSTPYVDTASTAAMCARWFALVALADNFPNAVYGGLTSNSNSLTTYLWGQAGGPTVVPPPVPTPGWGSPIWWVP